MGGVLGIPHLTKGKNEKKNFERHRTNKKNTDVFCSNNILYDLCGNFVKPLESCMMEDVYYKVTVTKGTMESIVYWWETSYKKFMESIELLYNVAKVDAVELEMITKEEYDRNYV